MKKVKIVPVKINDSETVYVKELLASDRRAVKRFATNGKGIDADKYEVGLVGISIIDDQGANIYSPADYESLESNYTLREYDKILQAITDINFLDESAEDIAGKP